MTDRDPAGTTLQFGGRALGSALRLHVRLPGSGDPGDPGDPSGRDAAGIAWSMVCAEFAAVDEALSRFRDDSELTALNRRAGKGGVADVSWRLRTAVAAAHRAYRITDGRFDATVLGVLERIGEQGAALDGDHAGPVPLPAPTPGRPRQRIEVPAAPLDMGGIGKGLALRWAAAAAIETLPAGSGLLLEAGGDLVHAGRAPGGGWLVGIEDPAAEAGAGDAGPIAVVAVTEGAVATSSVRVRRWLSPDGRRVHHIVDPRTGEPARTGLLAVTVAAADPAWAEVWSKALFLAGRGGIADEARRRGLAAWWVDDRGRLGMTPDARLRSAWVDEVRLG